MENKHIIKIIPYFVVIIFSLIINSCSQPVKKVEKGCLLKAEEFDCDYATAGYLDFTISNVTECKKDENDVFWYSQTNDSYRFVFKEGPQSKQDENLLVYKNGKLFKDIINYLEGSTHIYTPLKENKCELDNSNGTITISYYIIPEYTPQITVADTTSRSIIFNLLNSDSVNSYKLFLDECKRNPILIVTRFGIKGVCKIEYFIDKKNKIKGQFQQ